MQGEHAGAVGADVLLVGVLPVLVAACAYPAGNRKTMEVADGALDTWQRILAMTIASLPFWLVLAAVGLARTGTPSGDQLAQSAVVAVLGGVLATTLFFAATARVRHDPTKLAAVEATQSGEVVFAAGLEVLILGTALPVHGRLGRDGADRGGNRGLRDRRPAPILRPMKRRARS